MAKYQLKPISSHRKAEIVHTVLALKCSEIILEDTHKKPEEKPLSDRAIRMFSHAFRKVSEYQ